MAIVAITRLRLRSFRYLPVFAWRSMQSAGQAQRSAGFIIGQLFGEPLRLTFWTATVWERAVDMQDYRGAGVHQRVMARLAHWCDEASVAHWEQAASELPSPQEMLVRMRAEGRRSRVQRPSTDHAAGRIAADGRLPLPSPVLHPKQGAAASRR